MDCTEQNMAHAPFSHISGFVFSVAHPLANCKHLFVSGGIFVGFCRKPREWPPAGGIPRPIAVPRPRTATPFTPNFISPLGPVFLPRKAAKEISGQVCNRLQRRRAFCKGIVSTARRGGVPFVRTKGTKIRSRGTASPLTNPFLSLAVLDTNDAEASSVLRTDTLPR